MSIAREARIAVTSLLWLLVPMALLAWPLFDAPFVSYDVGLCPSAVVVADLDGDTRPDLVVTAASTNRIYTLRGFGDGSFSEPSGQDTGGLPVAIAVGDVNEDGYPDAVVANAGQPQTLANVVTLFLGAGDGTLGPGMSLTSESSPQSVALADFDADTHLDIAVANRGTETVALLFGNGDGTFAAAVYVPVPDSPLALAARDLNGDTRPDLAVVRFNADSLTVLWNAGGSFPARSTLATGEGPVRVRIADATNDGADDIIVSNYLEKSVSILAGHANGVFDAAIVVAVPVFPFGVDVGDIDGDTVPDLAVSGSGPFDDQANFVSVLRGLGAGTFAPPEVWPSGREAQDIAIADLDGDSEPDLAVASSATNSVSVHLNHGSGTFGVHSTVASGSDPVALVAGDLDGDGKLDLVSANISVDSLSVYLGQPGGGFGPRVDYETSASPAAIAITTMNADTIPDLVVANQFSNSLSVYFGLGDGSFDPRSDFETAEGPSSLVVGDWNADGRTDAAVTNRASNSVSVLLGRPDGSFGPKSDYDVGERPLHLAAGDLNGDGVQDLAVANHNDNTLSILRGVSDGSFAPFETVSVGAGPRAVSIADVNSDGAADLLVANSGDNTVSVLVQIIGGSPLLLYRRDYPTGAFPTSIAVADIGGDGRAEFFTTHDNSNTVTMYMGFGNGAFGERVDFGTVRNSRSVLVEDTNGDSRPDLVLASQTLDVLAFLVNRSDRTPLVVEAFAARIVLGRVDLDWHLPQPQDVAVVRLQRAAEAGWIDLAVLAPRTWMQFEDADVAAGAEYVYRLVLEGYDGTTHLGAPLRVQVPESALRVELHPPVVPGDGAPVRLGFEIGGRRAQAQLAIYDVRGRLVRDLGLQDVSPGRHVRTWDRLDALSHPVARGVYWVQLRTDAGAPVRRFVLLAR